MTINTNALKTYAPKARKDFIAAMVSRAAKFGITKKEIVDQREHGDVVIVGSDALPKKVGEQRKKLISRIKRNGFEQAMEAVAYTWFNRLVAIRYMEFHGFLDHGYRVLSHPSGKELPEILEHAEHLDFPRLDKSKVIELKLDGTKDAELYRMLLIAQCNALHRAMPFLFERIDDETEVLLPDNLLHSDSLIRKLVAAIDEADWQDIEVIGWLYQFYISEKKQQVFDRPKSEKITAENIPAATQLFTPHWIVRYLVENSLGRIWLLNRPNSRLAEQMDYYIAPEEPETDFLKIGKPEEIKVCDPACGSGHMLTYAFDLLHAIYEEEGYDPKEIPALILKHNLTGIEIDDRAGALAAFALSMKAAEKLGRRRFQRMEVKPDIVVLQDVAFSSEEMTDVQALVGRDLFTDELRETLSLFEQAKNFGSLIVPRLRDPAETLRVVEARDFRSDLLLKEVQGRVVAALRMAEALSPKYHVVVANPPYAGSSGLNGAMQDYAKNNYPNSKSDLFAMFMERTLAMTKTLGMSSMINMQAWMFLSSYEKLRGKILSMGTILTMAHLGERAFDTIGGAVVSTTAFVIKKIAAPSYKGVFLRLIDGRNESEKSQMAIDAAQTRQGILFFVASGSDFEQIPEYPIAYWITPAVRSAFANTKNSEFFDIKEGLGTRDDPRFLRSFWEVSFPKLRLESGGSQKWIPVDKAGGFRKWFGSNETVMNWASDGSEIRNFEKSVPRNTQYFFKPAVAWGKVATGRPSFRYRSDIFAFVDAAPSAFGKSLHKLLASLNSNTMAQFLKIQGSTVNVTVGTAKNLPFLAVDVDEAAMRCIELAKSDWDAYETSWDFTTLPLLAPDHRGDTLESIYAGLRTHWQGMTDEMQCLEEENNRIFIDAYGLKDELTPEVPIEEITLTCNPDYRYGLKGKAKEREERLRSDTMKELISYAIGCMMGRYSLAEPGLVYADAGNEGFDAAHYGDFPADDDGIVPITEVEWFDDDAALRFEEFLKVAWSPETLRENLRFVAESLTANGGNDPQKTTRNYISKSFFKDHTQTYKKRPIYWLFSSGKLRAFECLVYLHRYNESTLSRMRMEYVTPLQSRMAARIDSLDDDIAAASSSAARTKAQKEKDLMSKQLEELRTFDEELRHYADQRITLDLDDGVKVNYGKFGSLLAERKAITGEK
ncbi:BREX-1 system adenine-specific DNA-methyltransferase PglX [uncultured Sneathiella sp.]|jgi:type II restriction/modification system DNA methylase subunit YeeA|uniref:BREX-1 system adenine-specific DNA-methyltransferase PglX n=1 Tax=uncultured Sneathiella sp. TaxID=879315 RepID=UPI0030DD7D27|tara:strand:+ start:20752 stop:24261 length:3510 start_codon:yes stop_codon:yes gene_type:complete